MYALNVLKRYIMYRAGSRGPRAPRHAIWPGSPILATYNSSQSVKPLHQVNGGVYHTKTHHWLLFRQRFYIIQDRAVGVASGVARK